MKLSLFKIVFDLEKREFYYKYILMKLIIFIKMLNKDRTKNF